MEPAYLLAGLTFILALAGGLTPVFSPWKENEVMLQRLTGIAAGVLLASAMLVVIPEGFELAMHDEEAEQPIEALFMGGAILAGFLVMLILEGSGIGHAVHEEHHDHEDDHGHTHIHHQTAPLLLLIGLSLHAAADGLAIGSAAAGTSGAITALVALAVLIHKVPAAFSLGVFAMHQHDDRNKAIRDVLLFSLATPIFIIISFHALQGIEHGIIGLAMLFAGGTFLYVATVDTLPDLHNPETGRRAMKHVLIGAILLGLILFAVDAAGLIPTGH